MDMMQLRKMVMAQMASGAKFVKGTFTVPNDADNYTIQFGNTFSKYMFLVEMTDSAKTTLMSSGFNANKSYFLLGSYPASSVGNYTPQNQLLYSRINPSTNAVAISSNANFISAIDGTSITLAADALSGGLYKVYRGYEYRYIVVSLDSF